MSTGGILIKSNVADHCKFYGITEGTVFDVEPFGHALPSGLSLRVEDKAEWLRRTEKYSVFSINLIAVSCQLTAFNNFLCVLCG